MSDYSQPEFYHFNEDSLHLVNYVVENETFASHILDLGAGCGVIGIEIAKKLVPKSLTLIEIQEEFLASLHLNTSLFLNPSIEKFILQTSFSQWKNTSAYDLIVCNPPYFLSGHGIESPDRRKQICRTFVIDSLEILLSKTWTSLSLGGRAYFVLRNDQRLIQLIKNSTLSEKIALEERRGLLFLKLLRLNVN
jgi:tRNA1(Val) A37 N6-methylase TrmN6